MTMAKVQFPSVKYFPLSDPTKIKVIDKIEVADSESVFSLHENALVSEICAFYLNKSDIHFITSSNNSATSLLIENICYFIRRNSNKLVTFILINSNISETKAFLFKPKLDSESATSIT